MIFRTKRDPFFFAIWAVIILIIQVVFFVPLLFDQISEEEFVLVLFSDALVTAFFLWIIIDIRYEFRNDYLLVKNAFIRSKIKYEDITQIKSNGNLFVGYQVLFSRDTIELFYRTGFMGSVVISPEKQQLFIEQCLKRNPNIKVEVKTKD